MDKEGVVKINSSLYSEIKEYCSLNNLKINAFVNEMIKKQFSIEKFGDEPFFNYNKESHVAVDTAAEEESKTIVTVIDTKTEEIVEQKEVKSEQEVEEITEKYQEPVVEEKQKKQQQKRPKRVLK